MTACASTDILAARHMTFTARRRSLRDAAGGEHPARSDLHFTGTVVNVYKGDWAISEKISWTHDLDKRIPLEANKHRGKLFFVFTDAHSDKEIFLDTGDWPRWDKTLAQQIETALR